MDGYQIARILRDPTLHLRGSRLNALANRFADELEREVHGFDRDVFKLDCGVDAFYLAPDLASRLSEQNARMRDLDLEED